jgi:hypothetical protein
VKLLLDFWLPKYKRINLCCLSQQVCKNLLQSHTKLIHEKLLLKGASATSAQDKRRFPYVCTLKLILKAVIILEILSLMPVSRDGAWNAVALNNMSLDKWMFASQRDSGLAGCHTQAVCHASRAPGSVLVHGE